MKSSLSVLISFVVIIVIAYAVSFSGCSNPVTGTGPAPVTYPALTERDFIDTNFYAVPGSVVLLYLEHLHSPADTLHPDTDSTGTDVVRIRLSHAVEHTVKLGDSCRFTLTIKDKLTGNIVSELDPVNNIQTVTLPAGDYIIKIRSLVEYTGSSDTHQSIFFQPDRNTVLNRGGGNQQIYADSSSVHTLLTTNSCVSCDLSYANLSYANLSHTNLSYANLSYATLSYTNLSSADLIDANLSSATLNNAYMFSAFLSNANLNNANLSNASMNSVSMNGTNFSNANLSHTNWSGATLDNQTNMNHANLSYANLSGLTLTFNNLSYANLTSATLTSANLSNANLSYATLSSANLTSANLTSANLTYAILSYANLTSANLTNAILNNANFCNAIKTGIIKTGVHTNNGTQCWP